MTVIFASTLTILVNSTAASGAGAIMTRFIQDLSIQVPEPGMMLLFGVGAGLLGLRIGRKR